MVDGFVKHAILLFLAMRIGDFVNVAAGMWFLHNYYRLFQCRIVGQSCPRFPVSVRLQLQFHILPFEKPYMPSCEQFFRHPKFLFYGS